MKDLLMETYYPLDQPMKNLYFMLYMSFVDNSMNHFMWRKDTDVYNWDDAECIDNCISIFEYCDNETNDALTGFNSIMKEYQFPESVKPALDVIKQRLGIAA